MTSPASPVVTVDGGYQFGVKRVSILARKR